MDNQERVHLAPEALRVLAQSLSLAPGSHARLEAALRSCTHLRPLLDEATLEQSDDDDNEPSWWLALDKGAREHFHSTCPDWYKCPITFDIMRHPIVLVSSGVTYEASAIENWVSRSRGAQLIDPSTNFVISNRATVPNNTLAKIIREWCEQAVANKLRVQADARTNVD